MNTQKLPVAIIFGGRSTEHEVSIKSAKNVIAALDKKKFKAVPIFVTKQGFWTNSLPGSRVPSIATQTRIDLSLLKNVGVVFPLIHGKNGEDGSLQGLCELLELPYVGCGILSSAICMDKDITKRLLRDAGLNVANYIALTKHTPVETAHITKKLGLPLFVKPATMGSSVGVSKIFYADALPKAIASAFTFCSKVIVEEAIEGQEVECALLGSNNPQVSVVGSISTQSDFYDYNAKYSKGKATLKIPAQLSKKTTQSVQETAHKAYKTLGCRGMARVDMFVAKNNKVIVNEVNTIPGFTKLSMYQKLWESSGLPPTELITKLINDAF